MKPGSNLLDSNVVTGGLVSSWGIDKAVLSLCAAKICRLVLAEAVKEEVEENLALHEQGLCYSDAVELRDSYRRLLQLAKPELIAYPETSLVRASRHLIRHESDVPVLLSAMASQPDWLLTNNTKHFTQIVAQRTGLRIATPIQFFTTLSSLLQ